MVGAGRGSINVTMPPQPTPYNPLPNLPPPQPGIEPVFVPPDQQPKKRGRIVAIIIAALIVVGVLGYLAYIFLLPQVAKAPSTSTDTKHVGSYMYINACNAFTADDFESATGLKTNRSLVEASFASETDTNNPTRAYATNCSRYELPAQRSEDGLNIQLSVNQYADTNRTPDQLLVIGLKDAAVDSELGGPANFDSPKLTFQKDNLIVRVLVQGYGSRTDDQIQTIAKEVAKKVTARLAAKADLSTLAYQPELVGEGYAYQNACSLWGVADFEKQFDKVDKTALQMTYAETLVPSDQEPLSVASRGVHTSCVMGTKQLGGSFAYVDAYYFHLPAQAEAGYASYLSSTDDIPLTDLGDKAVLQAYDAAAKQYEKVMVLRGTTLYKVQFVPEDTASRGNDKVQADVKTMAKTILERLK